MQPGTISSEASVDLERRAFVVSAASAAPAVHAAAADTDVAQGHGDDGPDAAERAYARTLAAYDYPLDPKCVAQTPASPRDASRLLCLPSTGDASHHVFSELPQLLAPGDLLVRNETRVLPARLRVTRPSGAEAELLPFAPIDGDVATATVWRALGRPTKRLRPGTRLTTGRGAVLVVEPAPPQRAGADATAAMAGDAPSLVVRAEGGPLLPVLLAEGELPLPPYVERQGAPGADDQAAYQTSFARQLGAVAAPTASLHFTERTFAELAARGVQVADVVLHVGPGTFLPIRREHEGDVTQHVMHGERYWVPEATQVAVRAARARGGKVVMAGTTSLRAIETWAQSGAAEGVSRLYVRPGYSFRVADALLTNFHLPRTTLLMLVAAFVGRQRMLATYAEAQRRGYRFFSYGDASLLHAASPRRGAVPGEPGFADKEL